MHQLLLHQMRCCLRWATCMYTGRLPAGGIAGLAVHQLLLHYRHDEFIRMCSHAPDTAVGFAAGASVKPVSHSDKLALAKQTQYTPASQVLLCRRR